jgi:hypothetical protein
MSAMKDFSIQNDSRSNPGTYSGIEDMSVSAPGAVERLRKPSGVAIVFDFYGNAESLLRELG